jgi:ribosomal protein L13
MIFLVDDSGDHVVVINTSEIALPGDEWKKRAYFHHSGFPGGATWTLAFELHKKDPTLIVKKAIYRALGGNLQRHCTMQRLHLFKNDDVPKEMLENVTNQIRQLRPVPQRLDLIDESIVSTFPKIFDYPNDYVPKKIS